MAGSKHTIEIVVTGGAEKSLAGVSDALGKVAKVAVEMAAASGHAGESLEHIEKATKGEFLREASEGLERLAGGLERFTDHAIDRIKELVAEVEKTTSEYEDLQSSMKFAFGAESDAMMNRTLEVSQSLAFTTQQATDAVTRFGRMGVNVYGSATGEITKFKAKTGEAINSLEVMEDAMAGLGLGMGEGQRMITAVEQAMLGMTRHLHMMGVAPKQIEEIKKGVAAAGDDMTKKFTAVNKVLAEFYGGATKMREGNMSFQVQMLKDKVELLQIAFGKKGLKEYTAGLATFNDTLSKLLDKKDALNSIADAFVIIEKAKGWLLVKASAFIEWAGKMLELAPWLPKVALGLTLIAVAGATLTGALLTVAAGGLAVAAAISAIDFAAAPMALAFGAVTVAGLALVGMLAAFWIGSKQVNDNIGGTADKLEKIKVLLDALGSAWETYDGTTSKISLNQMENLKRTGMEQTFLDIWSVIHEVDRSFQEFRATLDDIGDYLASTFSPILDALGFSIDTTSGSMESWTAAGAKMAVTMGKLIVFLKEMWDVVRLLANAVQSSLATSFFLLTFPINMAVNLLRLFMEAASAVAHLDFAGFKKAFTDLPGRVASFGVGPLSGNGMVAGYHGMAEAGKDLFKDEGIREDLGVGSVGRKNRDALHQEQKNDAIKKYLVDQKVYDEGLGFEGSAQMARTSGILTPEKERAMSGGELPEAPRGSMSADAAYLARSRSEQDTTAQAKQQGVDPLLTAAAIAQDRGQNVSADGKALLAANKDLVETIKAVLHNNDRVRMDNGDRADLQMPIAGAF